MMSFLMDFLINNEKVFEEKWKINMLGVIVTDYNKNSNKINFHFIP